MMVSTTCNFLVWPVLTSESEVLCVNYQVVLSLVSQCLDIVLFSYSKILSNPIISFSSTYSLTARKIVIVSLWVLILFATED